MSYCQEMASKEDINGVFYCPETLTDTCLRYKGVLVGVHFI